MDPLNWSYILLAAGVVALALEVFLPTAGLLGVVGVLCLIGGVAAAFAYGDSTRGFVTLVAVCVGVPVVLAASYYVWPKTPFGKRLILDADPEGATVAAMPGNAELDALVGRVGRAVSPLRPSGKADFDGRRVDVLTEGMMVEPGEWVKCVEARAGRVVVRPVDAPPAGGLESLDFS